MRPDLFSRRLVGSGTTPPAARTAEAAAARKPQRGLKELMSGMRERLEEKLSETHRLVDAALETSASVDEALGSAVIDSTLLSSLG